MDSDWVIPSGAGILRDHDALDKPASPNITSSDIDSSAMTSAGARNTLSVFYICPD